METINVREGTGSGVVIAAARLEQRTGNQYQRSDKDISHRQMISVFITQNYAKITANNKATHIKY